MQRLTIIVDFWQQATQMGASNFMPRDERKRIILLNGMALLSAMIGLTGIVFGCLGEYLINGSLKITLPPAIIVAIASFVILQCLTLNKKGHHLTARYLFLSIWWCVVTGMCIFYGSSIRIEVYFLPLMVVPLLIFKKIRDVLVGSSIAIFLNAACQFNYHYNDPVIVTPPPFDEYRRSLHFFLVTCLLFLQFFYFRVQNEKSEALFAEEVETRKNAQRDAENAKTKALHMARTDFLTGLNNRRSFFDKAEDIKASAARHSDPFSIIMADIDHFKKINDTYGHACGDAVLVALADSFRSIVRESDVLARMGGEEFAILLPRTNKEEALVLANRICGEAEAMKVDVENVSIRFTISLGVATIAEDYSNITDLISQADQALYRAKRTGRNQVKW